MDQAKPEDQDFPRHHKQRGVDPGLDCPLCLPHAGLPEIQSQIRQFHATDTSSLATQPLRQKKFDRTF